MASHIDGKTVLNSQWLRKQLSDYQKEINRLKTENKELKEKNDKLLERILRND